MMKLAQWFEEKGIEKGIQPFYVTLVNLQVGSQKLGNAMAAPRVNSQIPLPSGVQGKLKFQTVNDYGSVTPVREVNLN